MAMRKKSKKSRTITIDGEGVEAGGRSLADGTYTAKIESIEEEESSEGNPMLSMKFRVTGKKGKGVLLYHNISLLPQALFRLRQLYEAIGEEWQESVFDIDLDDLVDKELKIRVVNETYEGKERPKVADYLTLEDKSDDEEEETEEEETEEEDEEEEEEDEEEEEEEQEDDEDEEEDDEAEEDSRPGRKPGKKKTVKASFKKGDSVKFKDEKGKTVKGKIVSIDSDEARVKDTKGETWELSPDDLEAA